MNSALRDGAAEPARLDVRLMREQGITRSAAQQLIAAGCVTVNGRPGKPGQRIGEHDGLLVSFPPRLPVDIHHGGERVTLHIVHEDDALAVVDKPAGMVVHPAPGHRSGTLADGLRQRGTVWSQLGGAERPGIVHRLDRGTSGLLVVAKTESAHRALSAQLQRRILARQYWALVHGDFEEASGRIEAPIGRDPRRRQRMAVVDGGRPAITDFAVSERMRRFTQLDVQLQTGRTHQIRVHLAYIAHPIAGDDVYGRPDPQLCSRPVLHAARLSFLHPDDGEARTFTSALPDDLVQALEAARRAR